MKTATQGKAAFFTSKKAVLFFAVAGILAGVLVGFLLSWTTVAEYEKPHVWPFFMGFVLATFELYTGLSIGWDSQAMSLYQITADMSPETVDRLYLALLQMFVLCPLVGLFVGMFGALVSTGFSTKGAAK